MPDYRTFPAARFPTFVEDSALATGWVHDHARTLGIDPRQVFLMGHSAGAHIAALVALDARYLAAKGKQPADIAGVVGIAGPYDFLPITSPRVREIFAGAADLSVTQPIAFASADAPPMLLTHGSDDRTVYPANSERLAAKLRQAGARVRLVIFPGQGHVEILLGLSSTFAGNHQFLNTVEEFFAGPDVW